VVGGKPRITLLELSRRLTPEVPSNPGFSSFLFSGLPEISDPFKNQIA